MGNILSVSEESQATEIAVECQPPEEEKGEEVVETLAEGVEQLKVEGERATKEEKTAVETEEELAEPTEEKAKEVTEITGLAIENTEESVETKIQEPDGAVEAETEKTGGIEEQPKTEGGSLDSEKTILILGGENSQKGMFDEMFVLNKDRSEWIELPIRLPHPMAGGGAVVLDGKIYIFGGYYEYSSLHVWDNENKKWKQLTDMNDGRADITNSCLTYNGAIWALGGYTGRSEILKSVERYDPEEDKWIEMPSMRCSRRQAAAAVSNGKIVVCGGMNKDRISVPLSSVECFDPESGVWSEWDEMPSPLRGHCIFSYGNALAVLGGHDGDSCVSSAIVWAETDKWYVSPMSMNHPCRLFTVAMLDGKLVAIGGWNKRGRQDLSRVEMMTVDGWTPGPDLPYECSQLSSLVIPRNMFD